ncbi:hypothetical protein ACGFIV_04340 [Sphaerisporangium sp. NPDC049003]|uniref:hypothetical protein n=1 Tax=Sphaerisporangium sp. NPDC049003 TaxID=3364517 RepID=UPI003714DC65
MALDSLVERRHDLPEWRAFRSSAGRWWATREQPYGEAAEKAGAWRTVDGDDELALARAIAEQESIAYLACPPVPEQLAVLVERQLVVLGQMYPAWRIERLTDAYGVPAGWRGTRDIPLTPAESAAGLVPVVEAVDAPALLMWLSAQDEIAHQTRYATGEP